MLQNIKTPSALAMTVSQNQIEMPNQVANPNTEEPDAGPMLAPTSPINTSRPLAAGDWLRVVAGFRAPFGHDGLPTVWG